MIVDSHSYSIWYAIDHQDDFTSEIILDSFFSLSTSVATLLQQPSCLDCYNNHQAGLPTDCCSAAKRCFLICKSKYMHFSSCLPSTGTPEPSDKAQGLWETQCKEIWGHGHPHPFHLIFIESSGGKEHQTSIPRTNFSHRSSPGYRISFFRWTRVLSVFPYSFETAVEVYGSFLLPVMY